MAASSLLRRRMTRCSRDAILPACRASISIPIHLNSCNTPKYTLMLYEYDHTVRRIYTDGRPLPKDPDPPLDGNFGRPLGWGHHIGRGYGRI